ncbi:MAG: hypothetical protein R2851_08755 [Caldilineaceae bacterium]
MKNLYLSVDPYMRGRMVDRKLHAALPTGRGDDRRRWARSRPPIADFAVGDTVLSMLGWRERSATGAADQGRPDAGAGESYWASCPHDRYFGRWTSALPSRGGFVSGRGRGRLGGLPDCQAQGLSRGGERGQ